MTHTIIPTADPIQDFLESMRRADRRPASLRAYASDLGNVSTWLGRPLVTLREFEFRRYLAQQRHLRPASLRRRVIACKRFFAWAEEHDLITLDPTGNTLPPKVAFAFPAHLATAEIDHLLQRLPAESPLELRNRALVWLLYYTGMRIGELQALNMDDLLWDVLQVRVTGRRGETRLVPLSRTLVPSLQAWLTARQAVGSVDGPLFLSLSKTMPTGRLAYGVVRQVVKEALTSVGLGHVSPHQLRHTFATQLLDRGAALDQVAALLGHARVDTAKKYVKAPTSPLRSTVDLLG